MKIGFWGAAGTVTGSRFVLDGAKGRMLIDCGVFQGGASRFESMGTI
jgi:metallo-beta-lactamase family protein